MGDSPVKSLDFLVFGEGARLVLDVKGRRFPSGRPKRRRYVWECWAELDDIDGLVRWATNGLFLGERHGYLNAQVDDIFLDSDLYPDPNSAFRITDVDASKGALT